MILIYFIHYFAILKILTLHWIGSTKLMGLNFSCISSKFVTIIAVVVKPFGNQLPKPGTGCRQPLGLKHDHQICRICHQRGQNVSIPS